MAYPVESSDSKTLTPMRAVTLVIGLSVALNLALVAALARSRSQWTDAHLETPAAAPPSVGPTASAAVAKPGLWEQLSHGGAPETLIKRLRRAGFPPGVLRQVAIAVVAEKFDAQRAKLEEAALNTPYWKKWHDAWLDPQTGPALRRLAREQEALLKQMLGDDAEVETEEQRAWAEHQFGALSGEKLQRVKALQREFNEKTMEMMSASRAGQAWVAADGDKLAAQERELHAKLAEFLTQEEVAEFTRRNGRAAAGLKFLVGPSAISEDEFRTLLPLYESFSRQVPNAQPYGQASHLTPEQAAARGLAADALSAQLSSSFGAARAEELKLALNPQYSHVARFAKRVDLPAATTLDLHTIGVAAVEQIDQLNADRSLTTEQRNERLQAVGKQGAEKIAAALGNPATIQAYHAYTNSWLLNLGKPKR